MYHTNEYDQGGGRRESLFWGRGRTTTGRDINPAMFWTITMHVVGPGLNIGNMTTESIEIVQKTGNGKKVRATLLKERELNVKDATKRKTIRYSIDIVALSDESQKKTSLGWRWCIAGIAAILVAILIPALLQGLSNNLLYQILIYIAGAGVGAGCFYMAWDTTSTKQIFFSRNSNVPLVELFFNKPSKDEVHAFVENLEQCSHAVQQQMALPLQNQLAGEMKMLRRLDKEGVISDEVYAKAKDELLSKYE